MPVIGNNYWADASNFGQGVGNALGQSLIQLPQERYQLALQRQQLQRALMQMAANQQYRQGMLANRYEDIQDRNQNAQTLNAIRAQLAGIAGAKLGQGHVEDGVWVPGVGAPGSQGPTSVLPPMPSGGISAPPLSPYSGGPQQLGGQPQVQSVVPPQPQQPPQQQLPGGIVPLPQRPMTSYQSNEVNNASQILNLRKLLAQAALMSSTNPAVQGLTNQLQMPQQQQGLGQTNRVFNYNPATGQLE
jgi:hypothetical protein